MANFPIRGVVTLTLLGDPLEYLFAPESLEFGERWLELADKALA